MGTIAFSHNAELVGAAGSPAALAAANPVKYSLGYASWR